MFDKTITVLALVAAVHVFATVENTKIREGKTYDEDLDSILSFIDNPCDTESQSPKIGICYWKNECTSLNGKADGLCAQGYGVCCVISGDVTISKSGSYFKNPGPSSGLKYSGIITATLKPPTGTTQIFLEFEDLDLVGPIQGDCSKDNFVVVGANPGADIPVICGNNGGQHMYIDIDNSAGPYKLFITLSDEDYQRSWAVKVTFYSNSDAAKAPPRCLQYHTETIGDFTSFNHASQTPVAINNHNYAICFAYVAGYCDTGVMFSRFDLGLVDSDCGDDGVTVGNEKICGDDFDLAARGNGVASTAIYVRTDDQNEALEEGFSGTYMKIKC